MPVTPTDTGPRREARSRKPGAGARPAVSSAPLAPTLALTVTLAVASLAIAVGVVELVSTPSPLPPPLPGTENQDAESALFVIAFALILPGALIAVPRLADAIAAGPNGPALPFLAALCAATLAASIILARVLPGGGVAEALAVVGVWCIGAAALLARGLRRSPWGPLLRVAHLASLMWTVAGALVLGTLLAFTSLDSVSPLPLALGLLAAAAVLVVYARSGAGAKSRMPRRWGAAIDSATVVLILLAVPDLVIFGRQGAAAAFGPFQSSVLQWHQDFVLGPANEVLHGGAMLVDTASQYGIGSIYFLAGWFQLTHIGYGTLGLLDGALFALLFAAVYCLLRLAGTSRLLAAAALALAVVVLIYNLVYSVGSLPAQHGPLRFGFPMIVIIAAAVEARWPRHGGIARATQFAAVGLASVWALEAFACTAVTFAAIAVSEAWTRRGSPLAWLARRAALALAAGVGAQLIFVAATLVFAGELPDYGWYLAFLHSFLGGSVGDITFDFSRWSPGLAVGVAYAASAAAFVLLVRRRRDLLERERVALLTIAGTTAYGIALFGYFVNRSADHILPYGSLPALVAGTLWLSLLLRGALGAPRSLRLGGLAFALGLSVLLTSVAWSSVGERFPRSALGHLVPGGDSPRAAVRRLWNLPPIDRRTPQGEYLVERYMPGGPRALTIVAPDLEAEILLRRGRTNELPLSYPTEDSFASEHYLPRLRRAVARLKPGQPLLTQVVGLRAFASLAKQPYRDPLVHPVARLSLAPLQEWVLQRIGQRFSLRVIHRDNQGFVVATLVPR